MEVGPGLVRRRLRRVGQIDATSLLVDIISVIFQPKDKDNAAAAAADGRVCCEEGRGQRRGYHNASHDHRAASESTLLAADANATGGITELKRRQGDGKGRHLHVRHDA